jgi:hypothetical protein
MSISQRYRELVEEVQTLARTLNQGAPADGDKAVQVVARAAEGLAEHAEAVGEIPRIRLEAELTPILLKAHTQLDRARLLLEEDGAEDRAAAVWDHEQKIYRLLNDL